jgi:hypothetical protein
MHALHLPPRQLLMTGLLALLLTLAVVVAAATLASRVDGTGGGAAPVRAAEASAPAIAGNGAGTPRWVADPLAPPSLLDRR